MLASNIWAYLFIFDQSVPKLNQNFEVLTAFYFKRLQSILYGTMYGRSEATEDCHPNVHLPSALTICKVKCQLIVSLSGPQLYCFV